MDRNSKKTVEGTEENVKQPRSLGIAERGIKTGRDFANLMGALMSDLIAGRIQASVSNATCNAGGKLLKVVELEFKYGAGGGVGNTGRPSLQLAGDGMSAVEEVSSAKPPVATSTPSPVKALETGKNLGAQV